ncbi:MAG: tRNA threonylcarbamoyladenosine dehydratase [Clostridia bacterium]|nr:tRNA threonylcarbamoyladenosine dehydratase [Clostridia bacterium]
MQEQSRTEMLLGKKAIEKLKGARVAVFGVGGVGGYTVEALARAGVGTLDLIDSDRVSLSNINRQIIALHSTVGELKVDVAKKRVEDINPHAVVHTHSIFYLEDTASQFCLSDYDYIVDAIDTVAGKLTLICGAHEAGVPIISSMGAGNKLDPTAFRVADIYDTAVCPLAKVMRTELRRRKIPSLKVVYSEELPLSPVPDSADQTQDQTSPRRSTPGSISFVPSVVGLIIAGEVIKDLTGVRGNGMGK